MRRSIPDADVAVVDMEDHSARSAKEAHAIKIVTYHSMSVDNPGRNERQEVALPTMEFPRAMGWLQV